MESGRRSLYKPLPPMSIRLFRINIDTTDVSAGSLEDVRLAAAPPYYALSHSWGPQDTNRDIILGSERLSVCRDLAIGIRRLRELSADPETLDPSLKYVWIDNICINLADPLERAAQVQLMRNIYSTAIRTLVWLGPAFPLSLDSWNLVDSVYNLFRARHPITQSIDDVPGHIYSASYHASSGLPDWDQSVWLNFRRLLELRWFSRIWVVQEVAFSKLDPILIHGEHIHSWNNLAWCASWLRRKGYARHPQIPQQILNIDAIRILRQSPVRWPLDALMSITQIKFHATDQRDKIYSLLGLALECQDSSKSPTALKPDYAISVEQAYCNVSRYLLERNGSLAFLTRTRGTVGSITRQARLHDLPDLPSWCPDWSDFSGYNQKIRVSFSWIHYSDKSKPPILGFPENYKAASRQRLKLYSISNDGILQIGGIRVDKIAQVIPFNERYLSKKEFEESFDSIMGRICAAVMPLLVRENVEDRVGDFIKTTTADQHGLHGRKWEQMFKDGSGYLWNLLRDEEIIVQSHVSYNAAQKLLGALQYFSARGEPEEYTALARNFGFNRAFIITKAGRIGLAPSDTRADDIVAVILGGGVPYILRCQGEHLAFVGESYVQGFMNGEGTSISYLGKLAEEVLLIK